MRIFGSDRLQNIMRKLGMEEGVPIEHGMVSRAIERAQKQVEGRNFETRKHLLEYDDVMNRQREEIYGMRREILRGEQGARPRPPARRDDPRLHPRPPPQRGQGPGRVGPGGQRPRPPGVLRPQAGLDGVRRQEPRRDPRGDLGRAHRGSTTGEAEALGAEMMRTHEKFVMLQVVDQQWKDHLLAIDHLKEGIGLRGYGQRDPLIEYKKESFELFTLMKERIEDQIVQYLFRLQPVAREADEDDQRSGHRSRAPLPCPSRRAPSNVNYSYGAAASGGQDAKVETVQRKRPKVGRNDPCPCGSGKKYKKCHGAEGGPAGGGGGASAPRPRPTRRTPRRGA